MVKHVLGSVPSRLFMSRKLREFRRAARRANGLVERSQSDEAWHVVHAVICKLIPSIDSITVALLIIWASALAIPLVFVELLK